MADEAQRPDDSVPPPGEPVHLPGPSYLPVITAFGITLGLCGILLSWPIVAIGGLIAVLAIVRWVKETREEIAELPLEH